MSRALGIATVALSTVLIASCLDLPEKPVAPTWEVQVSAAITTTSHSIEELVSDIANLPPEILDTLNLTTITLIFEETIAIGDSTGGDLIDSTLSDQFLSNVTRAQLFAEIENATPAHLSASLELRDNNGLPVVTMPAGGTTVDLDAAPLDAEGKMGPATSETTSIELYPQEIEGLESINDLYYRLSLSFPEGVTVDHVLAADSMSIRTWGTFWTIVNPH